MGLLGTVIFASIWLRNFQALSAPDISDYSWKNHSNVFIIGFKDRSGCGCLQNLSSFCQSANQLGAEVLILTHDPTFFTKPTNSQCEILDLSRIQNDKHFYGKREFTIWVKNGRIQKKANTISDPAFFMEKNQ